MNYKKIIASGMLGIISVVSLASGIGGAYASYNAQDAIQATAKTVTAYVVDAVSVPQASALLSQSGSVTIEASDLANVDESVNNLMKTVFEVLKLLPYIALIIGGFYLLDRLLGILPKPGS